MKKKIGLALASLLVASTVIEMAESFTTRGELDLIAPANAIVGRPLTPVSFAGAARRTVRRCAVGVYYC